MSGMVSKYTIMKKCNRCKKTYPILGYYKNPHGMKDGHLNQCKVCVNKAIKKHKIENICAYRKMRKLIYHRDRKKNIELAVKWARENRERRVVIKNRWRAKNKELTNHLSRNYNYRMKGAQGSHTLEEYRLKLKKYKGLCAYCGFRKATSKDHIIPLSRNGSNYIGNIAPSCVSCNSSKRDKLL